MATRGGLYRPCEVLIVKYSVYASQPLFLDPGIFSMPSTNTILREDKSMAGLKPIQKLSFLTYIFIP